MITVEQYRLFVEQGNFTKDARDAQFLSAMGLAGESGEVCDYLKKVLLHGKPLDREKLVDELGDVLWYLIHTMNTFDLTFEEVINHNVHKLCERYPDGYGTPKDWGVETTS